MASQRKHRGTFPALNALLTSPLLPRDCHRRATLELQFPSLNSFLFSGEILILTSATPQPLFQLSPHIYPSDGPFLDA